MNNLNKQIRVLQLWLMMVVGCAAESVECPICQEQQPPANPSQQPPIDSIPPAGPNITTTICVRAADPDPLPANNGYSYGWIATVEYPGLSVSDIAARLSVVAEYHRDYVNTLLPAGLTDYTHMIINPTIKNGWAGVGCGTSTLDLDGKEISTFIYYKSVQFILHDG